MPLTTTFVRSCKPQDKAKRYFDEKGLYLEVSPSGGKWWRFKYRFEGKEKRLSLGTFPDVSLKQARDRRDEARRRVADGIDPSAERKAKKLSRRAAAESTFEAVAREWFAKNAPNWAGTHSGRLIRRLEKDVFPYIGGQPVSEVTAPELLMVVQRIENRGALETARRALSTCGQIFRYAVATNRAVRDPTRDLKGALTPATGKNFAAITDPEKLGGFLRVIRGYQGTPVVSAALRLAPLVFVRPGELRHARWADIDLNIRQWSFTLSKTNAAHIVPLADQALAILAELRPVTGHGEFVFPNLRTTKRPMSDNAILGAMRRLGISKEEMSGHGFRAMARTILDEKLGFRVDFIEHQLGHTVRDPLGRAYNRTTHLPERTEMMQAWADYLDGLADNSGTHKEAASL